MDKLSLFVRARRMVACVSGGSFMASHRLGRRISDCVVASRVGGVWVGGWMLKCSCVLWVRRAADCVVGGSFRASHRLGRRISDCVVASRVWGCVGGC